MTAPLTWLKAWDIKPSKKLGQNFLVHAATAEAIVRGAGITPRDIVLEIGSGLGALTLPLARACQTVIAVEKDTRLAKLLSTELLVQSISNVTVMARSILDVDIKALCLDASDKLIVMGNLPYNISSQVLMQLLDAKAVISHAVVMLQKELAQRIMAPPGSKSYGRISAMFRYCADISKVMTLTADQFFPKPRVDSMVLRIDFKTRPDHPVEDEDFLFQVIKAAFGQRRKTLKNALQGSELHMGGESAAKVLDRAGIDPIRRAETLDVKEFVALSVQVKKERTEALG